MPVLTVDSWNSEKPSSGADSTTGFPTCSLRMWRKWPAGTVSKMAHWLIKWLWPKACPTLTLCVSSGLGSACCSNCRVILKKRSKHYSVSRSSYWHACFFITVIFIASFHSPDVIFEQLSIIYAIPRYLARSFTVILPYFPTGTMERVDTEGQIATAKVRNPVCVLFFWLHQCEVGWWKWLVIHFSWHQFRISWYKTNLRHS